MNWLRTIPFLAILAAPAPAIAASIYTIGNSLTNDTLPQTYANDWHIFCGRNLQFIQQNPNGHCVPDSLPWDVALTQNDYDYITVQPYNGTTLGQDVSIISSWIDLQPDATFVVHTGWTGWLQHSQAYNAGPSSTMIHSPEYFDALLGELTVLHPDTELRVNPAIDVLESINQDIASGVSPFDSLSDLYRDPIHMSLGPDGAGRYLQSNLMRTTLGLPVSAAGFGSVPEDELEYLNAKIASVSARNVADIPEPSFALGLGLVGLVGTLRGRR